MDLRELDAAQALLGVSPYAESSSLVVRQAPQHGLVGDSGRPQEEETERPIRRPRSGSEGLDYLAALAEKERHVSLEAAPATTASSSSDEDSEAMPPPPPRRRPRSVSNPEGMEKWDIDKSSRRHFVLLPAAILEEELAEAAVAVREIGRAHV